MSINVKKRVLIITSELAPYLESTEFAELLNKLSVKTFDSGMEIRVIMPRFGTINERRHRLHEVVRLSGINVVVDKEDHPLLIKVASLPNARLQVYFMDNEDFFKRKFVYRDAEEQFYSDNTERTIFFAKSALEIVKKFGWPPDVIHCHGWMTALVPMFLKTAYKKEPVFAQSKTIFTAQAKQFEESLSEDMFKMLLNSAPIKEKDVEPYKGNDYNGLMHGGCEYADVIVFGDENVDQAIVNDFSESEKIVVPYDTEWKEDISSLFDVYCDLAQELI